MIENQTAGNELMTSIEDMNINHQMLYQQVISIDVQNVNRLMLAKFVCHIRAVILIDIADATHETLNAENWNLTNFSAREDSIVCSLQSMACNLQ